MVGVAQKLGYLLPLVPYQEWYNALIHAATSERSQGLHSLLMLMPQDQMTAALDRLSGKQAFDTQNTVAGLAGSGIRCPPIDASLLERMLPTASAAAIGCHQRLETTPSKTMRR